MLHRIDPSIGALVLASFAFAYALFSCRSRSRRHPGLQTIKGPSSKSLLFGVTQYVQNAPDPGAVLEEWAEEYGSVYKIPAALGAEQLIICDLKSIAHIFGRDTFLYVRTPGMKMILENIVGRSVQWAEGESHKRQRKALNPAFSPAAIRNLTGTFLNVAYKLKSNWDTIICSQTTDSAVIEVQDWMNKLSIDSVGVAGFGHDFGALDDRPSAVFNILKEFSDTTFSGWSIFSHFLQFFIPAVNRIPTYRNKMYWNLGEAVKEIMDKLIAESRGENEEVAQEQRKNNSPVGLLLESERSGVGEQFPPEEIVAQMKGILIGGYDPPAMILSWALIELSRHQDIQNRLRDELNNFSGTDPTGEQLNSSFPILNSVVLEILRLHPSLFEIIRMAGDNDFLPITSSISDTSGQPMENIFVPRGTLLSIPIRSLNRSAAIWGPDSREFNPERWMENSAAEVSRDSIAAKKRLLTFGDGTRACLGRTFALMLLKAALYVLIKHYTFELPEGPQTIIEYHLSLLPRPKVKGQDGAKVPLCVRAIR